MARALEDLATAAEHGGDVLRAEVTWRDRRLVTCWRGEPDACGRYVTNRGRVRLWSAGLAGAASGRCSRPGELTDLVERAREIAQPSGPPPAPAAPELDAGSLDLRLARLPPAALGTLASELATIARQTSPAVVVETLVLTADHSDTLSWSTGPGRAEAARLSWAIALTKRVADRATSAFELTGCAGVWERGCDRLRKDFERLTRDLAQPGRICALPRPCRVFLAPGAVADLVVPYLIDQLSGGRMLGPVPRQPLSPLLSVLDDPRSLDFGSARARDTDGLATRSQTLIDAGKVVTPIADRRTAAALGIPAPALAGGPFGLTIGAGTIREEDLAASATPVVQIGRFTGDLDPTTGRFRGIAKCSRLTGGAHGEAFVEDFPIAGDLPVVLATLEALGATRELVRGKVLAPGFLVGDGIDC